MKILVTILTIASVVSLGLMSEVFVTEATNPIEVMTFNKDIAPIFFKQCAACHRPGELGPMNLLTYKDVRPWAKAVREAVITRRMPPWSADPRYGEFSNERRLSQKEIDAIVTWVNQGAKEGDPRDLLPQPDFEDKWMIGKPDLVLTMEKEYELTATGPDEYVTVTLPTNFEEDKWVQAVEVRPSNKKVVHHSAVFVQAPSPVDNTKLSESRLSRKSESIFYSDGSLRRVKMDAPVFDDGCTAPNGGVAAGSGSAGLGMVIGSFAPGKEAESWPADSARLVPAGSKLIYQVHYAATGQAEKDRSSIGIIFAKQPPEKAVIELGAQNMYFKIPAAKPNHEVKACYTFNRDVLVLAFLPHMHWRGKNMKYEAFYPNGTRDTLLYVTNYNFNWEDLYKLKKPLFIPEGTKIVVTAQFDNSEKNKYNPDPTKDVRWGDPSYDEMMVGGFDFISAAPGRASSKVDEKLRNSYSGEYQEASGSKFNVTKVDGGLNMSAFGMTCHLIPESDSNFVLVEADALITFVKDQEGKVNELVIHHNGRTLRAKKLSSGNSAVR